MKDLHVIFSVHIIRCILNAHWFFQESEDANCLQEFVKVVMEGWRLFGSVHVRVELLRVGLQQRWLFQMGILVQITEPDPVVQRDSASTEEKGEGPKIQLHEEDGS